MSEDVCVLEDVRGSGCAVGKGCAILCVCAECDVSA